jgi:signal transduction histidine kinase
VSRTVKSADVVTVAQVTSARSSKATLWGGATRDIEPLPVRRRGATIRRVKNDEGVVGRPFPTRWLTAPVFGWHDIGAGDIAWALLLGTLGVTSIIGLTNSTNHGGLGASLAVLLMTAPVGLARRQPVVAAAVMAVGAGLSWGLFDNMVRCGVGLPALFYVAFVVGSRTAGWRPAALGMALLFVDLICQAFSDPQLGGASVLPLMVPIAVGFLVAGRFLQRRNAAVIVLRARTAEARELREQNARLAVAADQARISAELGGFLQASVGAMAAEASSGLAVLAERPDQAEEAFVAIQGTGRETLNHMREVVADLKGQTSTEPQPVLAQLDRLLCQATRAKASLQVTGDPRLLPPGVELSGYRIIEHLLVALEDDPTAEIDVGVAFSPASLQLTVAGPSLRHGDTRSALAAVAERATLLGGTLNSRTSGGRLQAVVLIPLAAGYV